MSTSAPSPAASAETTGRRLAPSWIEDIAQARSLLPPFRLIAARLHQEITGGSIAPGSLLPSARALQKRFGVASGTVQSAMRVLKDEGLVHTVQGRGTYARREKAPAPAAAANPLAASPGRLAVYEQIALDLRQQITTGSLAQGARMPSGRELEQRYGVASMTARRALQVLRDEGLIHIVHGRGSFVARGEDESREGVGNQAPGAGLRHTVSTITDRALDELYAELAELRRRVAAQQGVPEPGCLPRPTLRTDARHR
ncbi:GntR family transcriptional regulator [Streptomyces griseoaurantiacus]|uniref:GntR family transcriptional regulator n=1 Tax=Streptomyces griseoaurantiacus TaxID=68213 RepID=UPI0038122034